MSNKLENIKDILKEKNIALSKTTCCFTGHRPQNLPWKFNEKDERCIKIKEQLRKEIINAIKNGYITFISGMALGFDIISAEIVLELKKIYPYIRLIGAIPCKTQDRLWKMSDKQRYRDVLSQLDGIRCIYDNYIGVECMIERNRFMINNSSLVIALYNRKKGGTKNTLDYAKMRNIRIVILK